MKAQFEQIHAENKWLYGSGEGSQRQHTRRYTSFLQRFLRKYEIKSVVDMGCGDWQFSQFIDWKDIDYRGFDVVSAVIEANQSRFARPNVRFQLATGDGSDLPAADLLIAKDILQHWSNAAIKAFLPNFKKYRYCLVTNCVNPNGDTVNEDIEDGGFRYLDLRLAPFHVQAEEVLSFTKNLGLIGSVFSKPSWLKRVLLIRSLDARPEERSPLIFTFENPRPVHNLEIAVLVPVGPKTGKHAINSCRDLVRRAATPFRACRLVFDPAGTAPQWDTPHPYRQEALAKIRQDMIDKHLGTADWVAWIDADIVDYPANLLSELVRRADGGIAAPVLLMDGELGSGRLNDDGFGPGKFFDVAGFVEGLRWARFDQPWFDQPGPEYSLDSVGSCYLVNAEIYRKGARHTADPYSLDFVRRGLAWGPETVKINQKGPANCFTEHFSVCQWAKQHGFPVRAYKDLVALHAKWDTGIAPHLQQSPTVIKSPDENTAGLLQGTIDPLRYEVPRPPDPDEVPGIVARMIPAGSKVIDVGCGDGALAKTLSQACQAEIVGVEPDAARAERARNRGLQVIADYFGPEVVRAIGPVDIVLFADVLEHLANPQSMLRVCRDALRPRGCVIVSIPNVAHWSVRLEVLQGRFRYQPTGIMDATHLRWFSRDSAKNLLESAGFRVVECRSSAGVAVPDNLYRAPLGWMPGRLRGRFLRVSSKMWPTLFGAQHVLKAEME